MLMRYSLSNGAASTGALAVIGGGTTIVTTSADLWGWAAIVVGLFVWAWAFSVDGEQWWRKWLPSRRPKSPLRIARVPYADSFAVVNRRGELVQELRSIAVCLQFSNHDKGAKTLRNIEAWLSLSNDLIPLAIRDGKRDLRDGEIALVELGRVTEPVTGGRQHLGVVKFKPFHVEENVGIYLKRPSEHRTLYVGTSEIRVGLHDNVAFRVTISADDIPAFVVTLRTNLLAERPEEWVKRYAPEKANAQ